MKNLYIQFREEKSGWKEKLLYYYKPIELKNVERDQELEMEEKLVELPKWKKKEKFKQKIEEIRKKEKINQFLFTEEVKNYLGEEVIKKEQCKLHQKINRSFLWEELQYLLKCQGKNTQNIDLYFLVNEYSKEMKEVLSFFALSYKVINILSKNQKYYTRWIERMEEKEQTNFIYSRNYRKSLAKAKIIINIDFTSQDLKKFKLNPNAILFNLSEEKLSFQQVFNGILVTGVGLEADEQKLGIYSELKSFSFEEIYLARMDPNLSYEEVIRKIKKDNVKVKYLKGINGIIDEKEYKCLL